MDWWDEGLKRLLVENLEPRRYRIQGKDNVMGLMKDLELFIKDVLKSQRQDLLKELRGEVEGMPTYRWTPKRMDRADDNAWVHNQDVIKLLEKYEK